MGALTVSELSVRSGVPVSTIHHYRQRGLLPPPIAGGGRRLRYDNGHVQALLLIRRLREQRNLPLQEIAEILPQLLASEQEAFRPAMWDSLLTARSSADPTLAAIVDVTISELAGRSLDEVTVGDVCVAAGIGKGTFYRYFDSKESAFIAAARTAADRVAQAVTAADNAAAARRALRAALAPVLPLVLELATSASRGKQPFLSAAPEILGRIVEALDATHDDATPGVTLFAEAATDLVIGTFGQGR